MVKEADGTTCPMPGCSNVLDDSTPRGHPFKPHLDHWYPVAGGVEGGVRVVMCGACNRAKSDHDPDEWDGGNVMTEGSDDW